MRQVLVVLLVLLAVRVSANDIRFLYEDAISAADTVAAAVRYDTVWSNSVYVGKAERFQFMWEINQWTDAGKADTNLSTDWFLLNLQHSFNGGGDGAVEGSGNWRTLRFDSTTDTINGGTWGTLNYAIGDSIIGNYFRGMFIHVDTVDGNTYQALFGNSYWKEILLWFRASPRGEK